MEQIGFVRKVYDNKVEVEVRRVSGCGGNCGSCKASCAESAIMTILLNNDVGAKEGNLVEIKAKSNKILKYTLIVYMIPFIMLVLGIAGGVSYFKSLGMTNYEFLGFGTGIISLAISFLILKIIDRNIVKKEGNPLEITRIIK